MKIEMHLKDIFYYIYSKIKKYKDETNSFEEN